MPIMGGGGGAAFNGGTITNELVVDTGSGTGQALELQGSRTSEHDIFRIDYPHTIVNIDSDGVATFSSDDTMGVSVVGTGGSRGQFSVSDDSNRFNCGFNSQQGLQVYYGASVLLYQVGQSAGKAVITTVPAAPANVALLSGVATQNPAPGDARIITPVTFNPTAGAAATCKVEISADNITFSTLWTETEPAGLAFDGTIHGLSVWLPAAWYIKLTAVNAAIGTSSYY